MIENQTVAISSVHCIDFYEYLRTKRNLQNHTVHMIKVFYWQEISDLE